MKIYFDNCCYNRPYDDQKQLKIHAEAEAIKNIMRLAQSYGWAIYGSAALEAEIGKLQARDAEKHGKVLNFYRMTATDKVYYKKSVFENVIPQAEAAGITNLDLHHIAFAVAANVDFLVTTDRDFIDGAAKLNLPVKVINPTQFPLGGIK